MTRSAHKGGPQRTSLKLIVSQLSRCGTRVFSELGWPFQAKVCSWVGGPFWGPASPRCKIRQREVEEHALRDGTASSVNSLPICPPKGSSAGDALGLLTEVGQRYADAKSYHIEAVEERTHSNELRHSWNKSLLKAIVAPGGRYRYEGRSDLGTTVLVSDGKTQWDYHVEEHEYTQSPVPPTADKHRNIVQEEMAAENAKDLADRTVHLAKSIEICIVAPRGDNFG